MKKIHLVGSFNHTMVDEEDYDLLNDRRWVLNSNGYATQMRVKNKPRKYNTMTNEIMKPDNGYVVDHIDGNKLNNCRNNLRIATKIENSRNRRKQKCSSVSIYKGIHCITKNNRKYYQAFITYNREKIYLGTYKNEYDAALAYNKASLELHGEFSSPNVLEPFFDDTTPSRAY